VVGDHDDRPGVEERLDATGRVRQALELAVGSAIEATCASGPFLCECVSLSGRENSRKSHRSRSSR
jgi:hypothetical protein